MLPLQQALVNGDFVAFNRRHENFIDNVIVNEQKITESYFMVKSFIFVSFKHLKKFAAFTLQRELKISMEIFRTSRYYSFGNESYPVVFYIPKRTCM